MRENNTSKTIRKSRLTFGAVAGLYALTHAVSSAPAPIATAVNPANNHVYYLLESSNWTEAENAAVGLGGHLVTINNSAENSWVWDLWGTNRTLWIGYYNPNIGGGAQHATNFIWISGEPSGYTNWRAGEPNGDRYTYIYSKTEGSIGGLWNDAPANYIPGDTEPPLHGVVEVNACTPHRATAIATVVNGFVVGAQLTDVGCGYTNVPLVSIVGGGGNGATATAILTNGRVTQINITGTGCCYTNAPEIVIGPPPMVPSVSIGFSKIKVEQNRLVVGWRYVLESSFDFVHWVPTGPEFTALSESIMSEFDLDATGSYFRLRVVAP